MIPVFRKRLLTMAAFALAVLFLGACGAIQGEREELGMQLRALEARLRALESKEGQITEILARARSAVVYIRGTYTFVDASGRPLRHVLNEAGEPIADAQGVPLVDLTGTGSIAVTNYCGTGFLAGKSGELLTNRHVAEPWWEDEASAPLLLSGLRPVFLRLRAFFQERAEPIPVEVLRLHEKQDVALIRTIGWIPTAEPLLLMPDSEPLEEGKAVILIGYPTGIEALLARLDTDERATVERATKGDYYLMVEHLARLNEVRPTITGGYLWEILPNTLVYDARTAAGGSGGPLLDHGGRVIGVNAAYLPEFGGANYGVPIRFGHVLLASGGLEPDGPTRETPGLVGGPDRRE